METFFDFANSIINGTEFEKAAMLRAEGTYDPCLKDRGFK